MSILNRGNFSPQQQNTKQSFNGTATYTNHRLATKNGLLLSDREDNDDHILNSVGEDLKNLIKMPLANSLKRTEVSKQGPVHDDVMTKMANKLKFAKGTQNITVSKQEPGSNALNSSIICFRERLTINKKRKGSTKPSTNASMIMNKD